MDNKIIFIRWGENFDSKEEFYEYLKNREYNPYKIKKSWRDWIAWALSKDFEVFEPQMPNKQWADYAAWKIWFEKLFPYLWEWKVILFGHSLGWAFLMKYLSENTFPKLIDQLHFISPTFDNEWLVWEKIWNMRPDVDILKRVNNASDKIFLYTSKDDLVVPFVNSQKYKDYVNFTQCFEFHDRWHFDQPAFPELLDTIYKHLY